MGENSRSGDRIDGGRRGPPAALFLEAVAHSPSALVASAVESWVRRVLWEGVVGKGRPTVWRGMVWAGANPTAGGLSLAKRIRTRGTRKGLGVCMRGGAEAEKSNAPRYAHP